jgi:hypothetical protein
VTVYLDILSCRSFKKPCNKAAASESPRRTAEYVEGLSDARTQLRGFFKLLLSAEVVKWQTRTFEGRVAQAVRVQVPPSAPSQSQWAGLSHILSTVRIVDVRSRTFLNPFVKNHQLGGRQCGSLYPICSNTTRLGRTAGMLVAHADRSLRMTCAYLRDITRSPSKELHDE